MQTNSYLDTRQALKTYFDRTAVQAWEQLTSEAPVSRIRQTVRAGRAQMFNCLLNWLPEDLTGKTVLDAGCGTGAFAIACARRGARVTGIDLSPKLINLAQQRAPLELAEQITFEAGDMLSAEQGAYNYVVAVDSVIHYQPADMVQAISQLQANCIGNGSRVLFTFAPRTLPLMLMKSAGKLFPREDRSPAIEPVREAHLRSLINSNLPDGTQVVQTRRIDTLFYKSQAMEIVCP